MLHSLLSCLPSLICYFRSFLRAVLSSCNLTDDWKRIGNTKWLVKFLSIAYSNKIISVLNKIFLFDWPMKSQMNLFLWLESGRRLHSNLTCRSVLHPGMLPLTNVVLGIFTRSPLVIQGQRIQTPPSVNTTTWLNRSRVGRVVSRTPVGAANARFPHPTNKTFLSTLPENSLANAPHEAATRLTNKSWVFRLNSRNWVENCYQYWLTNWAPLWRKKSLYSVRQWGSQTVKAPENRIMMRTPQCAVYMGSRTAESQDGLTRKEALTRALVVIILNETLAVLETRVPGMVPMAFFSCLIRYW